MNAYIGIGIIAAVFIAALLFKFFRSRKIRKNGIETDAVLSRIEEEERATADGTWMTYRTYYVTYRTPSGILQEAAVVGGPKHKVGDEVRIRYMEDKPEQAVILKDNKS